MTDANVLDETQVAWQVDGIEVAGSLTRPVGTGPFPAVIMVAGSGPTDRNWNSPLIPGTNGSAALLAQALAGQGFVVLRYDKRASGPHAQENVLQHLAGKVSMEGHRQELEGGVRLLAARADVDAARIFILGNSEGCIHALNYQTQAPPVPAAGLVLTAAPARPIGEVARSQIAAQLAALPGGESLLAVYDKAMADFAADRPVTADESLPEAMRMLILGVTTPVNQPFSRELWTLDPLSVLKQVRVPILIVIGKKDIQTDWQSEGTLFAEAAAHQTNITVDFPANANHVLKYEPKPRAEIAPADVVAAYSADDTYLDEEALAMITGWLARQAT
ncbi:MAG TPA: hypothetical protein P5333_23170 [Caldilinea sp.]|nr:hypothetical protein [Caldilinea sp.]